MPLNVFEMAGVIRAMRATLLSLIETHPDKETLHIRLAIAKESELSMILNENVPEEYIAAFEKAMDFYDAAAAQEFR